MLTVCVEVFRTDVEDPQLAEEILVYLRKQFPGARITFALDDCDRILRIAGEQVNPLEVEKRVRGYGVFCQVLE